MSNLIATTRPMTEADVSNALELWNSCEGIGISEGDTIHGVVPFLARNPGTSWVSVVDGQLVGAVLGGHDGRRGFLYHLAVRTAFRNRGLGATLVERCLASLHAAGIQKCHVMVFRNNPGGQAFWNRRGFRSRADIDVCTRVVNTPT